MPRPRDIVGLRTTGEERSRAVQRRAVEVNEPYRVFKQHKADGFERKGYCLVYVNPLDHSREMVMQDILDKATANDLRELCERAWVLGLMHRAE